MKHRLLLVEDNRQLRTVVKDYFLSKGYEVTEAGDGQEALEFFELYECDLVILDVMMPNMDGFSLTRRIRRDSDVPIIIITARDGEEDMLYGYDLGADDYVSKPFSLPVIFARTEALLKRVSGNERGKLLKSGQITVDQRTRRVTACGKNLELPAKEYELLVYFMLNKGIVLSRDRILNRIWGADYFGSDRVVDTHIKKLRAALGQASSQIRTVVKAGYKFEDSAL